uniref:hypothetical protein n=1 Tax=Paenibacillus sp. 32O-W TaxID=1695218 RepID=UPI001642A577
NHLMECTDVFQFLLYMLSSTMFGIEPKKYKDIFDGLYSTLGDAIAKNVQDKIVHGTYDPLTDGVDIIPYSGTRSQDSFF